MGAQSTQPAPPASSTVPSLGWALGAGLIAGVIAIVLNLILYFVGQPLAGGAIDVMMQPGTPLAPLPVVAVIAASLVPSLVAALVYWLLLRFVGAAGRRIFILLAAILLLLSFYTPFTQTESMIEAVLLSLMHVVVAGAVIWALTMRNSAAEVV